MSNPKITIVTSSYWRPDLLRRTIQSVQNQSFHDYEHIIVSDHDPFTEHVCAEFAYDERIRFIPNENPYEYNLGAVSFRIGLENAKSDYLCYVLDDDILLPNHLETHYNHFMLGNEIGHSGFHHVDFPVEQRNARSLVKFSLNDLLNITPPPSSHYWSDVSRLSHTVELGLNVRWKTQTEITGGKIGSGTTYEDNLFMGEIGLGPSHQIPTLTTIKCQWGGVHRSKETKGVDREYYESLMEKLVEDSNSICGYRFISKTPYVYPDFKDTLL